jgi:hypothetical protein
VEDCGDDLPDVLDNEPVSVPVPVVLVSTLVVPVSNPVPVAVAVGWDLLSVRTTSSSEVESSDDSFVEPVGTLAGGRSAVSSSPT